MKVQSTRGRHRIRFAALALCTLALALAACGSDDEPEAPASGDSGNAATDTSGAAAELVAEHTADQTEWRGPTEAPAPVSGKTIGIVPCGMAIEGCARQARGGEAAAKALGWKAIMTDGQGDGAKLGEAITSLINRKVDAIYLASVNAEGFGEQLGEAEKQGIPVIASFASDPTPLGGLGEVGIDYKEAGRTVAAFMVTNGGGDVVVFNQNESPAVAARAEGLKEGLEEFGGGEVAEEQSIPNTQLGQPTADLMASILQRNPEGDLKWMFAGFDFMLTSMMQAAEQQGRMELKGVSFDGNKENLAAIAEGRIQAADVGYPLEWAGWAVMDELNRHFNEEPWVEAGIDYKLLTKDNLPPNGAAYTGDLDYEAKYRELWGL